MNELWVARDGNKKVWLYGEKPRWAPEIDEFRGYTVGKTSLSSFPDLLPGQCRRLVMESEASE